MNLKITNGNKFTNWPLQSYIRKKKNYYIQNQLKRNKFMPLKKKLNMKKKPSNVTWIYGTQKKKIRKKCSYFKRFIN